MKTIKYKPKNKEYKSFKNGIEIDFFSMKRNNLREWSTTEKK